MKSTTTESIDGMDQAKTQDKDRIVVSVKQLPFSNWSLLTQLLEE